MLLICVSWFDAVTVSDWDGGVKGAAIHRIVSHSLHILSTYALYDVRGGRNK